MYLQAGNMFISKKTIILLEFEPVISALMICNKVFHISSGLFLRVRNSFEGILLSDIHTDMSGHH